MSCATEHPGSICRGMVRPNDRTWATTWTARSPETGFREQATSTSAGQEGRPTLKTIAFMTGLGVTTVSRALKDAPEIGEETRRRVQLVARQVGYRPNRAGVRLRTGKTNVISLILDTEEQVMGFVSDMIYGISEASRPDAVPSDRHALFAQQRSAGAGPLCRRDRLGRRHHHFAHRARRCARPLYARSRLSLRHARPHRDGDRAPVPRFRQSRLRADRGAAAGGARPAAAGAARSATDHSPITITCAAAFEQGLLENGLAEVPFNAGDHRPEHRRRSVRAPRELMRRPNRPDGIVSGAGAAAFAIVAGIEDAGLRARQGRRHRLEAVVAAAAIVPAAAACRQRGCPPCGARTGAGRCWRGSRAKTRARCRASACRTRWSRRDDRHLCQRLREPELSAIR